MWGICIVAALALSLGCTNVQKGTAAGGAAGTGIGALAGHAISSVGVGPGAVVGMGLGALAGAVASGQYYDVDGTAELATADTDALARQLAEREAALAAAQAEIERERAQQKAILEAYEKLRAGQGAPASAPDPDAVHTVTAGPDDGLIFTIESAALFSSGSATLSAKGKRALQAAVRDIRSRFSQPQIEVRGHTDSQPIRYSSYKSNYALSVARAQAVVNYLVESQGFQPSEFTLVGCGDTQPVASNATADGRQKNRRAELVVRPRGTKVADVR